MLNFYQINRNGEIWTCDHLVIKALILCQRTNSTQKLKLLGEVLRYDLYYSLTVKSCGVQIYNKRNKSAGLGVQSSTKKITWTRSTPCSILIKQNTTINLYVIIIIIATINGNTTTSSTHHHASLWTFALLNCVSAQASKLLWCVSTNGKGSKASMVVCGGGGGVAICCCCCYI